MHRDRPTPEDYNRLRDAAIARARALRERALDEAWAAARAALGALTARRPRLHRTRGPFETPAAP